MKRRLVRAFAVATSAALIAAGTARAEPMVVLQTLRAGDPGLEGMGPPRSLAVSADGAHVYAAASDGALWAFARNASGRLAPIVTYRNGEGGIAGLDYPTAVVVSADGANVYVASQDPPAIAVFQRDAETGLLSFLEAETEGLTCEPPYFFEPPPCPRFLAMTPDDSSVLLLADGGREYERDPATGALQDWQAILVIGDREIVQSADGSHLYGMKIFPGGHGEPTLEECWLSTRPVDESASWSVVPVADWGIVQLSPTGDTLYGILRSYEGNFMCWGEREPSTGFIGPQTCRPEDLTPAVMSAIALDGTLYVADAGSSVLRWRPEGIGGALGAPDGVVFPIGYPRDLATSPDSRHLYASAGMASIYVMPESNAAAGVAAVLALALRFASVRRGA